jgi:transposase
MAERRAEGRRLIEQGRLNRKEVAARLGVHPSAVSLWAKALNEGGPSALEPKVSTGRPPSLTPERLERLLADLEKGPLRWGYPNDRWTLKRAADVLIRSQGIRLHPAHLCRVLGRAGFSPQRPQKRALERDEAAIEAWVVEEYPRIKRGR